MSVRYSDGSWLIEGDLPNALVSNQTPDGLIFSTKKGECEPSCFGLRWELACDGGVAACDDCVFGSLCFEKVLGGRFSEFIARELKRPTVDSLVAAWASNTETIEAFFKSYDARSKVKRSTDPGGGVQNPTGAPFVASVTDGASVKKGESASPARVPAGAQKGSKWGPWTYVRRCMRERRRSDYLSVVPIGTVLVTKYLGVEYRCLCLPTGWDYQGHVYPTLQAVTTAIAGVPRPFPKRNGRRRAGTRTMANYSAKRFWRLKQVVPAILRQIGYSPGSATMGPLPRWETFSGGGLTNMPSG